MSNDPKRPAPSTHPQSEKNAPPSAAQSSPSPSISANKLSSLLPKLSGSSPFPPRPPEPKSAAPQAPLPKPPTPRPLPPRPSAPANKPLSPPIPPAMPPKEAQEILEGLPQGVMENLGEMTGSFTGVEDPLKSSPTHAAVSAPSSQEALKTEDLFADLNQVISKEDSAPKEGGKEPPRDSHPSSPSLKAILAEGEVTGSFTGLDEEELLMEQSIPASSEDEVDLGGALDAIDHALGGEDAAPVGEPAPVNKNQESQQISSASLWPLPLPSPEEQSAVRTTQVDVDGKDPLLGTVVLNYRLKSKIAEGGMGVIYLAHHVSIGRPAAVKILKPQYCRDEAMVQRFYQEGRLVNQIRHENIIDIFDFGKLEDGRVLYVMELLEGETLADRLVRKGPIPFQEALPLMEQATRALAAVHAQGIVHRDIKPDNFWLKNGEGSETTLKLLDFGIAKLVGAEFSQKRLTRTSSIIGTPHYMSPEQLDNREPDVRSDVYSLGMVFYEMFAGDTPFGDQSLAQIVMMHIQGKIPLLSEERCRSLGAPPELRAIIGRATALSARDRYQSMEELLADLRALRAGQPVMRETASYWKRAEKPRTQGRAPRTSSRFWLPAALLLGALVAVAALLPPELFSQPKPPLAIGSESIAPETLLVAPPSLTGEERKTLRERALTALRKHLLTEDALVRAAASRGLGEVGDKESRLTLEERLLAEDNAEVLVALASGLSLLGDPRSRESLEEARRGKEGEVTVAIDGALSLLGDASARKRLLSSAKSKQTAIRLAAGLHLAELGDTRGALSALSRIDLGDLSPEEQLLLVRERARLGDKDALETLKSGLSSKQEAEQLFAAATLARLGYDLGRDVLTEALLSKSPEVRLTAATALLYLGEVSGFDSLKEGLKETSPDLRRRAAQGLGILGDEGVLPLLEEALDDQDPQVQVEAEIALLSILGLEPDLLASAGTAWIEQSLSDKESERRLRAVKLLKDLPPAEAVPLLTEALKDPSDAVREEAARLLAEFAEEAARQSETAEELRRAARQKGILGVLAQGALAAQGDPEAKEALLAAAASKDRKERLAAIGVALAAGQTSILLDSLEDGSFEVRFQAAVLLAESGNDAGADVLREGLKSGKTETRTAAAKALHTVGAPVEWKEGESPEALFASGNPALRAQGASLSILLEGKRGEDLLRKAIYDPSPEVRLAAVEAATIRKDTKLLRLLSRDKNQEVRAAAKLSLSKITEPNPPAPKEATPPASNPTDAENLPTTAESTPTDAESMPTAEEASQPASLPPLSSNRSVELVTRAQFKMSQGDVALANGRASEALKHYREAHEIARQPDIQWYYGECYRRMGDSAGDAKNQKKYWERALSAYTRFAKSRPKDTRASKAQRFAEELKEKIEEIKKKL